MRIAELNMDPHRFVPICSKTFAVRDSFVSKSINLQSGILYGRLVCWLHNMPQCLSDSGENRSPLVMIDTKSQRNESFRFSVWGCLVSCIATSP